ncbi:MAG TPA: DUF1592 domain-containing protein [Polyangia bacterium]
MAAAVLPLFLSLSSCTGSINEGQQTQTVIGPDGKPMQVPVGNPPTGNPPTGNPPTGTPTTPVGMNSPVNALAPFDSAPSTSSRFLRLNHTQWENTVRELLKLPSSGVSERFITEPRRSAFDTNGGVLTVSQDLWTDYRGAAETLATKVSRDAKLLAAIAPAAQGDVAARGKAFIQSFGQRAFRRPLTDAEVTRYATLFAKGPMLVASMDAFADGVELVIGAMLQSPNFLYRIETSDKATNGKIALNDYEVASRLSYGLLNSMPDEALFAAAAAKKLSTRDGVLEQAKRLIATPGAQTTLVNFHDQLLRMGGYDSIKKENPLFPTGIGADIKQEALTFAKDVVFTQGKGFNELMTGAYTFANARVAKIYGVTAAGAADQYNRVALPEKERAGLLTQIGFLTATSEGSLPNSIIRGVHIAEDVLCLHLPPPPDNVPALTDAPALPTNRLRVEALTKDAACSACHASIINPLGFAFENFDGLGKYRTAESNGQPIDATGTLNLDGQQVPYNGAVTFIKAIAGSKQANECYAQKLAEYVYGREVNTSSEADKKLVAELGSRSKNNVSVKDLVLNLVATDAFLTRLP